MPGTLETCSTDKLRPDLRPIMSEVLLLCEYPTLNGGERSMLSTLDEVRAAGFVPWVVAPAQGPLADALGRLNVEVTPLDSVDPQGKRLPQDRLRQQLARLIERRRPDLLHANSLAMGRLAGPVADELQLPSLAHLRDIVGLSRQAIADLNRNTRLLAVSEAVRQSHAAAGLAAEKIRVLHNGVDLQRFRPRPPTGYLHRELGLPPEAMLVGVIGQIGLRKGQDLLARAAASLADGAIARSDLHYLIVGQRCSDKDESRRFEADLQAAAAGRLDGRLHLLGVRDDVERIMNELTLLVHPARQEPLGRVLLEAAAAGLPVLATDVGGTREIFPSDSHSARLIPPDDAGALAAGLLELATDESQRIRLGAAARRRAEEAFDIRQAAAGLVGHYRELTSQR